MRVVEIVRVDTRGRITMPATLRDSMGITEGMHIMLIGDLEKYEIRILPFADPEAELFEIHVTLTDRPGALAKIASMFADNGFDLLTSQSRTLRRGRSAEWFSVVDISKSKIDLETLSRKIRNSDAAEEVEYKKIE